MSLKRCPTKSLSQTPLIKWFGSKFKQRHRFLNQIPDHRKYLGPTFGTGAIPLNRPRSKVEVYSDINPDLINLYTCDYKELMNYVKYTPCSLETLMKAKVAEDMSDDPAIKALKFLILNRMSYLGTGNSFQVYTNWDQLPQRIEAFYKRFAKSKFLEADVIEQIHGSRSDTFIDIDPPYYGTEYVYKQSFNHSGLLERVVKSKAKIMICNSDNDLYNYYLKNWHKESWYLPIGMNNKKRLLEVCWRNYAK